MNSDMNGCDTILELLSLYLDDELDDVRRGRMRRHLTLCPECARTLQELRALDTLFRQAPMQLAPTAFTERVVQVTFDDAVRRSVGLGLLLLLVGTIIISSIVLLGYLDLFWLIASIILAPGFLSSGPLWFAEIVQALQIAVQVSLVLLDVLRALLFGPLLIPSLGSLAAALFLAIVLRQEGQRTTATLAL